MLSSRIYFLYQFMIFYPSWDSIYKFPVTTIFVGISFFLTWLTVKITPSRKVLIEQILCWTS